MKYVPDVTEEVNIQYKTALTISILLVAIAETKMKRKDLKPLNSVVQICDCGKVDAYKDDGHDCATVQQSRFNDDYYD